MPRTVVIGDVHGCATELDALLTKLDIRSEDRVFLVGDLIGRGPDSLAVLDMVAAMGATSVQGNHERRMLEVRRDSGEGRRQSRLGPAHRRLFRSLRDRDWELLESMPLFIELPAHDLIVVHAGLDPQRTLDRQDPWVLTHIRSFDQNGRPTHALAPVSWAAQYHGPSHVVFGHNALLALQLHEFATGIDSGCVYGGRLTALVLDSGRPVPPVAERGEVLVSVPARRHYYDPRK